MPKLDAYIFEVSALHRVSYHDYFRDYEKLDAFLQGMGVVRDVKLIAPLSSSVHQITIDLSDKFSSAITAYGR